MKKVVWFCWAIGLSLMIADVHGQDAISDQPQAITNSIGINLVPIPAGRFTMGSPASERGSQEDEVLHKVDLTQAFHMGATEVTEHQWAMVMEEPFRTEVVEIRDPETKRIIKREEKQIKNPKLDSQLPISDISWSQAVEFCKRLGQLPEEKKEGRNYRLPTEAEWEYACRAGTSTVYCFGDEPSALHEFAWYGANSTAGKPTVVASKHSNVFGLHDMHGNVSEWCSDYYGAYSEELATDPTGAEKSSSIQRIVRGGSSQSRDSQCRAAWRGHASELAQPTIGLRVVLAHVDSIQQAGERFKVFGRVTEIPLQIPQDDASEPAKLTRISLSPSGRYYWAWLDTKMPATYVLGNTVEPSSQRVYPLPNGVFFRDNTPVWNEQESYIAIPVYSKDKGNFYLLLNPIDGAYREFNPAAPTNYIERLAFTPTSSELMLMYSRSLDEHGEGIEGTRLVRLDLDGRIQSELKVADRFSNGFDFVLLDDNYVAVKGNSFAIWNLKTKRKVSELHPKILERDRPFYAKNTKQVVIHSPDDWALLRWDVTDPTTPQRLDPIKGIGELVSVGSSAEYFCSFRDVFWQRYDFFDGKGRLYETIRLGSNPISFSKSGTLLTGSTSLKLIRPTKISAVEPLFMVELPKDHRINYAYSTPTSSHIVFRGRNQLAVATSSSLAFTR